MATVTRLRALDDADPNTKSLRILLGKVKSNPQVFTRSRYLAMSGASDSHTRERSNREFDENFGAGAGIDPQRVEADLADMASAMVEVTPFVNRRVAHLDPNWQEVQITYRPIYEAVKVFGRIVEKYTFLFKGYGTPLNFGHLIQFDVRRILQPHWRQPSH